MVTEVKPVQLLKAWFPICVTELGMVTEVRPLQPEKAEGEIDTHPLFNAILVPDGIVPLYL